MKTYEEICREVEEIDPTKYPMYIERNSRLLIPVLARYHGGDELAAKVSLINFYIASAYADGKFKEDEFESMFPLLFVLAGSQIDLRQLRFDLIKGEKFAREYKNFADTVIDDLGNEDEEIKEEFIKMSLMVCSVDGKISKKEKWYIQKLIK